MNIQSTQIPRYFALVFVLFLYLQSGQAQEHNFWSKVKFGGNIGIGFSNNTFNGVIAPSAIYELNDYFSFGVGLQLGYTDSDNFQAFNYGGSLISLFHPIPELQLSLEFEEMGVHQSFELDGFDRTDNFWYPSLFIGAGYRIGNFSAGLRYDILYNDNKSIYSSPYIPFIRVYL